MTNAPTIDITQWFLVAAALALAPVLFSLRGAPPGRGDVIEVSRVFITANKRDLSCALPGPPRGYHCRYLQPDQLAAEDSTAALLQPFKAIDGRMFLVADPFAARAPARRNAEDFPLGKTGAPRPWFVKLCRLRLIRQVPAAYVRYNSGAPWSPTRDLWIAEVISCEVKG